MDFDLSNVAVPFRMQPGLRKLTAGEPQLTRLDPQSQLHAEKRLVQHAGHCVHAIDGFDPSPALEAIRAELAFDGPLELAFEEDFAILEGATGTLPWLCVCVPSHWAPEEKVGLDFMALHAPVADNAALLAASRQLVTLVTAGERWERFVWTLTPSPRYDQHPHRHPRPGWPQTPDHGEFAHHCFVRAERQTFLPVGRGTRQAVFTIGVMLTPLTTAVDTPGKARRLHDSLASMSAAVLAYKGLTPAREPLMHWLAQQAG